MDQLEKFLQTNLDNNYSLEELYLRLRKELKAPTKKSKDSITKFVFRTEFAVELLPFVSVFCQKIDKKFHLNWAMWIQLPSQYHQTQQLHTLTCYDTIQWYAAGLYGILKIFKMADLEHFLQHDF